MSTEIAEYSKTEAALADLEQKYKGVVFDVTTAEGMQTARKECLAEEEKQREIQRKKNELLDAREMLSAFKSRFGHIEEFAPIVKAIDAYNRNRAGKPAKEIA